MKYAEFYSLLLDSIHEDFNVYTEFIVEVDSRFGVYSGCTPNIETGIFECNPYTDNFDCWYNSTGPSQTNSFRHSFENVSGCNYTRDGCKCPAWLKESVGYYPCPECDRHASWHKQTLLWKNLEDIANMLNGSWYSTRAEGECAPGQLPGNGGGCWWREVEARRTVNASCLNDRLISVIQSNYPLCWDGCAQPNNATSDCYIECLLKSLNGYNSSDSGLKLSPPFLAPLKLQHQHHPNVDPNTPTVIPPMTRKKIVDTFKGAFLPVGLGGCPEI